jgi:thiol-disulfide isomerase/thioredoxin
MNRIMRWVLLGLLGIGAAVIGIEVWRGTQTAPVSESAEVPVIALPDLDGRQRNSAEWQGRVVLVNFWATWCAPCVREVPELVEAQRRWGDQGLQVVGIALDQGEPVHAFAKRMAINYPVLIAGMAGFDLSQGFGNDVLSIPFTVVLDRTGRIRHRHLGVVTPAELAQWLPPLLAEPVAPGIKREAE